MNKALSEDKAAIQAAQSVPPAYSNAQRKALESIVALCRKHNLDGAAIHYALADYEATKHDVKTATPPAKSHNDFLMGVLGNLGGALIIAGFLIYVSMMWPNIGSFGRVLLSLGAGILCFAAASFVQKSLNFTKAAIQLWLLSIAFIPTGLFVLLKEYAGGDDAILGGVIVFALCCAIYLAGWLALRINILLGAALAFGFVFLGTLYEHLGINQPSMWLPTGLGILLLGWHIHGHGKAFYAISSKVFSVGALSLIGASYYYLGNDPALEIIMTSITLGLVYMAYRLDLKSFIVTSVLLFIILMGKHFGFCWGYRDSDLLRLTAAASGLAMCGMGYWIKDNTLSRTPPLWIFLGSFLFYNAFMGLLYDSPYDVAFAALPVTGLYLSARLRSRAVLISSILALLSFIGYFSARYFADTIGWPITLMVTGAALIGICIFAIRLDQRMRQKTVAAN